MAWRLAHSLIKLRDQFNERFPVRNKSHDGSIGDAAHKSRSSDHNPWIQDAGGGVVSALDVSHDPGAGVDTHAIAELLRQHRDPRVKYVISNHRIFSSQTSPWTWRPYKGSNPHVQHLHVSVLSQKSRYDSTATWMLVPEDWRPNLRRGDRGPYVRQMQQHLGVANDGVFGAGTRDKVMTFQSAHGLTADGVVGTRTWAMLDREPIPRVITATPGETDEPPPPDEDEPSARPVLRKGARGDDVAIVQQLLMVKVDSHFGPSTEAAVKAFQRGSDLPADGIVGALTWEKLDEIEQTSELTWYTDIVATVFGGKKDPNKSAYENRWISDSELGVALPFRFTGDRPQVVVANPRNGKTITAEICDVGPWNISDGYWLTGSRPQAETGRDMRGRKTNRAGIDLTPGAARALGINGLGKVSWAFANEKDEGEA